MTRIGEVSLKAFELAQLRRPLSAVICAGAVMRFMMKDPEDFPDLLDGISMGYRLGLGAENLLAHKWEEHWDRPVSEWREMLKIKHEKADPAKWAQTISN